jgi:hypothetical protein
MTVARALLLVTSLALAGCYSPRGVVGCRAADGRPAFATWPADGYWIWEDERGWHLRTASEVSRRFHGVVETIDGTVKDVRAVGTSKGGVSPGSDAIAFDWESTGGEQGFDWASSDRCARFELYIDEDARPLRIHLGRDELTPTSVPFAACR